MNKFLSFILCGFMLFASCSPKEPVDGNVKTTTHKIAFIYPFSRQSYIEKLVEWSAQNAIDAQSGMSERIVLDIERYDEETVNLDSLGRALSLRRDIEAVIGPEYSDDMSVIAMYIANSGKPLISPWASSAELARQYSGKEFFWSLVESDITQCEILLSRALNYGRKKVSLITPSTTYGNSFNDWFAFQATEMGLNLIDIYVYDPETDNLIEKTTSALSDGCEALLCVPARTEDAISMLQARNALKENTALMLFSDMAYQEELLQAGNEIDFAEGISPSGNPVTGFGVAYATKYGESTYEPQLYDAFMILYMAFTSSDSGRTENLEQGLKDVLSKTDADGTIRPELNCWTYEELRKELNGLRSGGIVYDISGASGELDFNVDIQSSILKTTFVHWMAYNGRFITIDYLATDGSHHSDSTIPSWEWNVENVQSFSDTKTFSYPEHKENWALLIATSSGWLNYRHQADVLKTYGILKSYGYDDRHIVLVMEDDLIFNIQNRRQGEVQDYYGNNLYPETVVRDYKLSEITPDDIVSILTGQKSSRLPEVLEPTANDNVLVFWSGHGVKGALSWGYLEKDDCMTYDRMLNLLKCMRDRGCYRKMLWQIEACYSASVALAASQEEFPGVMMITAADVNETSKADLFKNGIYYTDRFSRILYEAVEQNPDITYRDLYYEMVKNATGSHPRIINNNNFDNLYKSSIIEFYR